MARPTVRRPLDSALESLPIGDILPQIRAGLQDHQNLVLQAQTGAGKTTTVPLEYLRWDSPEGRILVLQPRRIAAIGAARRMADLWGDTVGETVGYRIRHDSACGRHTRVEVITEGILVRMLHSDRALQGVSCIFFDEFHERGLDSDVSFALALAAQREWNPRLRLIVMSATLSSLGERLSRIMGGCPQIFSEGRLYAVSVKHACWMEELQTQEAVRVHQLEHKTAEVVAEALEERAGDVLVFLPGEKEIMYTWIYLNNDHGIGDGRVPRTMVGYGQSQVKHGAADLSRKISVCPLYGNLDQEEQDEVLSPAPPGGRKVILATPIAESSITVPGVRIVIDSGLRRIRQYAPQSNMSYMKTVQISKASADQRKGRAGRVAEGICYRMWHEYEHRHFEDNDWPEIVKEDLTTCVLDLAVVGVCSDEEISALPWLDPPPDQLLGHARDTLWRVKALEYKEGSSPDHHEWSLLPRGRHMARLPLHPRASHIVAQVRARFGRAAVKGACNLGALLDEKDPLRGGRKQHGVDLVTRYAAVYEGSHDLVNAVRERVLSASRQMQALLGLAPDTSLFTGSGEEAPDKRVVGLMLAWAYPELVAQKSSDRVERPKGRSPLVTYRLSNGSSAKIDAFDKLGRCEWLACAAVDGEKVLWAAELDPEFCLSHGLDVRSPERAEVFDTDWSSDTGSRFEAPPAFLCVLPIDLSERRVDPSNGKHYTFPELEKVCSEREYSAAEIRTYWRNECTVAIYSTEKPSAALESSALKTSGDSCESTSVQANSHPASAMTKVIVERGVHNGKVDEQRLDIGDGLPYTFAELRCLAAGRYSETEIQAYWRQCDPVSVPPSVVAVGAGQVSPAAALARIAKGLSIEEWLLAVDDHGHLRQYAESLAENYDTAEQIVGVYTLVAEPSKPPAGAATRIDPQFFEDLEVCKLGHRRMFERWFAGRA